MSSSQNLFASDPKPRLSMYPIEFPDIWEQYKAQVASFWTAEEIDFSKDREQWNSLLTDDERAFIKSVLAFFAGSDSVVSLNLMNNFCREVPIMEAQVAYTYQAAIENIHSEVYSIMIDTYVQDPREKADVLGNLGSMQYVRDKVAWAEKWALKSDGGENAEDFPRRLLAFVIVEGLFFSGAFCAIYWIKQRNLLPGLTKSNEFIARDEGMHTQFGMLLYSKLAPQRRLSQDAVHAIFRDAIDIEKRFITESVPCGLVGMNARLMAQYIEHVADGLLAGLGYERLFNASNPFPFMELIGLNARSNFFEERVSLYQKAVVSDLEYTDDF
jgi:ribonucleoside-diphosphate reductase beta chain